MDPDCSEPLLQFERKLIQEWLPTYGNDPARNYGVSGFKGGVRSLTAADALDFTYSIDSGLVIDVGGGRYRAPRSMAIEVLFWEGSRTVLPRPITLWLEPVITIGALGRLHREHGWPKGHLGLQSSDSAFDLVAYVDCVSTEMAVAGEIKKSSSELTHMMECLHRFAAEPSILSENRKGPELNAARKWTALAAARPALFWAVGPAGDSRLFAVTYDENGPCRFESVGLDRLQWPGIQ